MKGIIIKDLLMIKNYCKSYILFLIIFLVFPMFNESSSIMSAYLFIIPSMAIISVISFDERNNWELYFQQLPISIKDTVLSKYIIGGSISLLVLLLYSICAYLRYDVSIIESLFSMSVITFLSFAFTIPFYFRFGSHVGRIAYYISLGLIVFIVVQFQLSINTSPFVFENNFNYIITAISFCLFIISYFISIKLYEIRLKKLR